FITSITIFLSNYFFFYFSSIELIHPYLASPSFLPFISVIINMVILTILYKTVLSFSVSLGKCFMGGLIAAVLFEASKAGFGFYIYYFSSYTFIYGALAAIPVFLIWMYLSWMIVLFGAIFVHESSLRWQKKS